MQIINVFRIICTFKLRTIHVRGHNWVYFAHSYRVQLPLIQTLVSYKLKIAFNQSKIIIWAYSLREKGDWFLGFVKAFSSETDFWVTLGDFTV